MAPLQAEVGFWGKPTALIDWCEENYVVTSYIAEFWNTISNLIMIIPPLVFAYQAKREGLERRYFWLQFTVLLVGIGSWLFHMTLRYGMQITDELPMVFGSCFFIYTLFENCEPSGKMNQPLAVGLFLYSFLAICVYLFVQNPVFFQTIYGLTVVATVARALYNIKYLAPCRQVWYLYFTSFASYLFAFVLWNVDQIFCQDLRLVRLRLENISAFLAPFSQLHALWHLLAAHATYQSIVFNCLARQIYLGRPCELKVACFFFPYLSFESNAKLLQD